MDAQIVMFDDHDVPTTATVVTVGHHLTWPSTAELLAADVVELALTNWGEYGSMASSVTDHFTPLGQKTPPMVVRLNIVLAESGGAAIRLLKSVVGPDADRDSGQLWYVGTYSGLAGLFNDLKALKLGDGVRLVRRQPATERAQFSSADGPPSLCHVAAE